ncbi:NAD(P)H-dependent oxidoreductase [Paracoccus suum]|uniref:NAD(P)H-dependent oxidoreductase n=1 Tax=Paracoccus suum TaxID=2259340 RepID=A0A344PL70_9RHOB|nr:NADPH-dependent FMN reductase [Paracoccus suum]AXC50125.1 NAD(P)H-dependent oxidoreductase [Paracoccus suum]
MPKNVAVLVGSLRSGSINRKLAHALEGLGGDKLTFENVEIGDLPLYNEDLWAEVPAPVTRMKRQIEAADGVLIVSPEYNRGYPGILANTFDWGSRPSGQSSFTRKPVGIIGATGGATGTAAGQQHLRLAAVNLGMIVMHAPEMYITWNSERFGPDGEIKSDDTRKLLQGFVDAFAAFVDKHG